MKRIFRSWPMHNLVAHPLSEILHWLGLGNLGNRIHDATLPVHEEGRGVAEVPPSRLWKQAHSEFPDDNAGARVRFQELMREAGYIIDREPGDDSPLFECGYDGGWRV